MATTIIRRNPPGTKGSDWCNWAEQSFGDMESTLAVQQFIQQQIRKDASNCDEILRVPSLASTDEAMVDDGVWKYEHLRQACMELNGLAVLLQSECSAETCAQMSATEQWIYLCASHKTPKECPAIDYTLHALDGAASLLNSARYFSSRVQIKEESIKKLGSISRRIYRIFSHAYYHHRSVYERFEKETHLCQRFTKYVLKYQLVPPDNLIVPVPGVEGIGGDLNLGGGAAGGGGGSSSIASAGLNTTVMDSAFESSGNSGSGVPMESDA